MSDLTISRLQTLLPKIAGPENRTTADAVAPFSEYIKDSLSEVNRKMQAADKAVADLASGANPDIHNTMIAMQKAEVSFELVMQIRNKLIAAYDEIRRMAI